MHTYMKQEVCLLSLKWQGSAPNKKINSLKYSSISTNRNVPVFCYKMNMIECVLVCNVYNMGCLLNFSSISFLFRTITSYLGAFCTQTSLDQLYGRGRDSIPLARVYLRQVLDYFFSKPAAFRGGVLE